MPDRLKRALQRLNLAQRFMLATLLVMVAGMVGISGWVGQQIEAGVIRQSGTNTALLVEGFVTPQLQDYGQRGELDRQHMQALDALLNGTPVGKWVAAFTIRDMSGKLLYSSDATLSTLPVPTQAELAAAARGETTSEIDRLESDRDSPLRKYSDRLVKTYSPVRLYGSGRIFAIIEFYQDMDPLQAEIDMARGRSWLVVGIFVFAMYVLLAIFSKRTGDTIDRQQEALQSQVLRLTSLLEQNRQLNARVRSAAASIASLHERLLRRTGAELHDGPAQYLGLALMQMDMAIASRENETQAGASKDAHLGLLTSIQSALQNALTEVRAISAGLGLPQLAGLSPAEVLAHAIRAHERRTRTAVGLEVKDLPAQLPLPIKITIYRLVQEALNNAFKHAGGARQEVNAGCSGGSLRILISDEGPGFNPEQALSTDDHLGLAGMHERVESLGGTFQIESRPGQGTKVSAVLNLAEPGGTDE